MPEGIHGSELFGLTGLYFVVRWAILRRERKFRVARSSNRNDQKKDADVTGRLGTYHIHRKRCHR